MSKNKSKLEMDKFYYSYGGGAHPSLIYEKTQHKTYKSVKFGTTKKKHMTEIKPIQKGHEKSYVHNRPFEGTRIDYGDRELKGLAINDEDRNFIDQIKKRKPQRSARARKHYK